MAMTCKVVLEIQFSRSRMPKKFLEGIVKELASRKLRLDMPDDDEVIAEDIAEA